MQIALAVYPAEHVCLSVRYAGHWLLTLCVVHCCNVHMLVFLWRLLLCYGSPLLSTCKATASIHLMTHEILNAENVGVLGSFWIVDSMYSVEGFYVDSSACFGYIPVSPFAVFIQFRRPFLRKLLFLRISSSRNCNEVRFFYVVCTCNFFTFWVLSARCIADIDSNLISWILSCRVRAHLSM